jgi:hypothetical protein
MNIPAEIIQATLSYAFNPYPGFFYTLSGVRSFLATVVIFLYFLLNLKLKNKIFKRFFIIFELADKI